MTMSWFPTYTKALLHLEVLVARLCENTDLYLRCPCVYILDISMRKKSKDIREIKNPKLWFRPMLKKATEKYDFVKHPILIQFQQNFALWVGLGMSGGWYDWVAFPTSN